MDSEVLVGPERRRRWSALEKSAIIEETLRPNAVISDVARRHGISRALLYQWRHVAFASVEQPAFVPIAVSPGSDAVSLPGPKAPAKSRTTSEITVELPGGARVTLRGRVEMALVRAVLAVFKS